MKATTYELTVVGRLGPLLRHAMRPHTVSPTQTCTIVHAGVPDTMDLVDLVLVLEAKGLNVDGIFALDR